MNIYLDNAATTEPCEEAKKSFISSGWANSSSQYDLGLDSERAVLSAKNYIANLIGTLAKNLVFTSGGTESNNSAIFSVCSKKNTKGGTVYYSASDHSSVVDAVKKWADIFGQKTAEISVNKYGEAMLETVDFRAASLICLSHVNSETGAKLNLQKLEEMLTGVKIASRPSVLIDGVQAFCKLPISEIKKAVKISDFYSVSAHKVHAYKGVGALYISNPKAFTPMLVGGNAHSMRAGTENVPGIMAFESGIKACLAANNSDMVKSFKDEFLSEMASQLDGFILNSSINASPYVISISFKNIKSEALIHMLDSMGFMCSAGSACSTKPGVVSHTVLAIGVPEEYSHGTIRISLGSMELPDVKKSVRILVDAVKKIRTFM